METYYDGFCGFKTIKEFHKMYPENYSVENLYDLFEIKKIKKGHDAVKHVKN